MIAIGMLLLTFMNAAFCYVNYENDNHGLAIFNAVAAAVCFCAFIVNL